ncbi:hypothetical protein NDU88_005899 [Pleurodeles waltl]|uniref:Uncharacterized protein n=1 Tax=Pleurodeles waltl TaxID=8319 RepID=A0AAV7N5N1_PLEWA|nr:hypothetical protein NDU88_005899 [Pleurodeles waltl]
MKTYSWLNQRRTLPKKIAVAQRLSRMTRIRYRKECSKGTRLCETENPQHNANRLPGRRLRPSSARVLGRKEQSERRMNQTYSNLRIIRRRNFFQHNIYERE